MGINQIREKLNKRISERDLLRKQLKKKKRRISENKKRLKALILSQQVLSQAVTITQKTFEKLVESLTNRIIGSIWTDRKFKYKLDYKMKGRKTTAQPLIIEGKNKPQIPSEDMGISMLDPLSFGSRCVMKVLERPPSRNMMWLDEPLRNMGKGKELRRGAAMLREMSYGLNMQLIIITHEEDLARIGDRVFYVEHNGKHSIVRRGK